MASETINLKIGDTHTIGGQTVRVENIDKCSQGGAPAVPRVTLSITSTPKTPKAK